MMLMLMLMLLHTTPCLVERREPAMRARKRTRALGLELVCLYADTTHTSTPLGRSIHR